MVDMSDTTHFKTIVVSKFVVGVSQSAATAALKRPRAPWLLHMQTATAELLQQKEYEMSFPPFIPALWQHLEKQHHQRDFGATVETTGSDNRSSIVGGFVVGDHQQSFDAAIDNLRI
jgi:hypothetical protein